MIHYLWKQSDFVHFGSCGKSDEEALNFRVLLDEKTQSNLKLLKGGNALSLDKSFPFNSVFSTYRKDIIFKNYTLVSTYVLTTNNL